jgi:hypothetical protein
VDERLPAALAYLIAAAMCLWNARREPAATFNWRGRPVRTWGALAAAFAALAVLKGSGIEAHLVNQLRDIAMDQDWYDNRRPFQQGVVVISFLAALGVVLYTSRRLTRSRSRAIPLVAALAALGAFLFSRAVSLHRLDGVLFRSYFLGVLVNIWVECALVLLVAAAAWYAVPRRRPS